MPQPLRIIMAQVHGDGSGQIKLAWGYGEADKLIGVFVQDVATEVATDEWIASETQRLQALYDRAKAIEDAATPRVTVVAGAFGMKH